MAFPNLFKPIFINDLEIRNRIVLPAIEMGFANPDGSVSREAMDFYVARAKGGVGLIIVSSWLDLTTRFHPRGLFLDDDSLIASFKRLTEEVKRHGARVFLQVQHYGPMVSPQLSGSIPIAPSAIPSRITKVTPREMTVEEIREVERRYGDVAYRAYKAGFDGYEIHIGVGGLINRFLSQATNKRSDEYGGDLENRMRILVEICHEVRRRVPKSFVIGCRMSAEDWVEGGNTIEDTKIIARRLEDLGIHYINVVVGWHESPRPIISREVPPGGHIQLAYEIKKVVSIPVIGGIRIKWPDLADRLIGEGKVDMVFLARALIADPEWPKKAREGRVDEIRPCIGCTNCLSRVFEQRRVDCSVNPRLGNELHDIPKVSRPKRILIVGAGPAGLEAAITLAQRGHLVTVIDRNNRIGGAVNIACKPPYKAELRDLINYYETMLRKYGVKLMLGRELDDSVIDEVKPEVIIAAMGAKPIIPQVPGVDKPHVTTAVEILEREEVPEGQVVVIGGGGVGLDVADYLSEKGVKVVIVEMLPQVGQDVPRVSRWVQLARLRRKGVEVMVNTRLVAIEDDGVVVEQNGRRKKIEARRVVLSVGMTPNNKVIDELRGRGFTVFAIGDCHRPARILDAIKSGYEIGLILK